MCGDPGHTRECTADAVTASGDKLVPASPQIAIAAPVNMRIRGRWIGLTAADGTCQRVRLVDKMNARYIGKRGFDLTPGAQSLVTGKPATRYWTGNVSVCKLKGE